MSELLAFLTKNPVLSLLLLGTLIAWVGWELRQLGRKYKMISAQRLVEIQNREKALIIDLNDNNEFLKRHIDGAVNVPLADLTAEHKFLKGDKDRQVVVYDHAGIKAEAAALKLITAGFKQVSVLDGGLESWLRENFPTVKGR